jgi:hypothetical protein
MILQGLKPRIYNDLNKFGRRWMKELPSVVWSLRTAPSRAMSFTPFFLVYGAEAILPTDLEYGSPRTRAYTNKATEQAEKTHWTSWKRLGTWPYYTRRGISSPCDATTPKGFGPETSRWVTWCFGYDRTPEGAISSHLPRKGRSSLPRF